MSPADDHLVRAVFPSNGAIRVLCSCDHRSTGSDHRTAHEAHDAHVAESCQPDVAAEVAS